MGVLVPGNIAGVNLVDLAGSERLNVSFVNGANKEWRALRRRAGVAHDSGRRWTGSVRYFPMRVTRN